MSKWPRGADVIEVLLGKRHLEQISGSAAISGPWFKQAERRLRTAEQIVHDDPESAFILAYDAARFVGTALLAQQGLRPTQAGGHITMCDAVQAQFGGPFGQLSTLRRRRNELEYPAFPDEQVEPEEVLAAIATTRSLLNAASKLTEHLGLYI